ncbi:MAG: acyl-CoA thioesterase [Chlamydiae bacterium RIFCSPHIGHO2_12_FULL_49_11]|nr:MAG: acyl-CoA thioesterase [Chlamydiae bacterium RIFCSPHIGHO2_12_FULL_49_11]
MEGHPPGYSGVSDYVYKIFPNDLNSQDTVFGGTILSLLDRIALVVAERHSGKVCVTVSIDAVHFLAPAKKGENLIIKASINNAWNSSMEIGLKVISENGFTKEQKHIVSAYFTFVAVDVEGKPTRVPRVLPESPPEMQRFEEANHRRSHRIRGNKERAELRKTFSKEVP